MRDLKPCEYHCPTCGRLDPFNQAVEDALRAEIAALKAQHIARDEWAAAKEQEIAALKAKSEWRTMDSAPKGRTQILVTGKTRKGQFFYVARCREYATGGCDWIDDSGMCYDTNLITHWMPLPEPPKE